MRLFLETASTDDVRDLRRYGVISGVFAGLPRTPDGDDPDDAVQPADLVLDLARACNGLVVVDCEEGPVDAMVDEARRLAAWWSGIVVRMPVNTAGLEALGRCSDEGIRVAAACATPAQALLAAVAGAAYVDLDVGALAERGSDGIAAIGDCVHMIDRSRLPVQLVAAGLQRPDDLAGAAAAGAHAAAITPALFRDVLCPPADEPEPVPAIPFSRNGDADVPF